MVIVSGIHKFTFLYKQKRRFIKFSHHDFFDPGVSKHVNFTVFKASEIHEVTICIPKTKRCP